MRIYETAGQEAERELTAILGREGRLYRDDILLEVVPRALRLSSSYEELLAWWQEPAYVRPGFSVAQDHVDIPCFLAVVGRADEKVLLEQLQIPTQSDMASGKLFFSSFHLLEREDPSASHDAIMGILSMLDENILDSKAMMSKKEQVLSALEGAEIKPLAALSETRKRAYLNGVIDTLALWLDVKSGASVQWRALFVQLIFGCERIVSAFSSSIYQDQVVKCTIALRQDKPMGDLAAIRVLLMHHLAFDVLIVVKGAQSPLEAHLPKPMFNYHLYQSTGKSLQRRGIPWGRALGAVALVSTAVAGLLLLL